jgi:hypothetical protein
MSCLNYVNVQKPSIVHQYPFFTMMVMAQLFSLLSTKVCVDLDLALLNFLVTTFLAGRGMPIVQDLVKPESRCHLSMVHN